MIETKPAINQIQDQITEEFGLFDDWTDKYEYIIEMGKNLPALDEKYKIEENKIFGCQSTVWLHAELTDNRVYFEADSDGIISKGLISMLIRVLSGQTPDEIFSSDIYFIEKIGMAQNFMHTRSNGLLSMIKQMRFYALAFKAKG